MHRNACGNLIQEITHYIIDRHFKDMYAAEKVTSRWYTCGNALTFVNNSLSLQNILQYQYMYTQWKISFFLAFYEIHIILHKVIKKWDRTRIEFDCRLEFIKFYRSIDRRKCNARMIRNWMIAIVRITIVFYFSCYNYYFNDYLL